MQSTTPSGAFPGDTTSNGPKLRYSGVPYTRGTVFVLSGGIRVYPDTSVPRVEALFVSMFTTLAVRWLFILGVGPSAAALACMPYLYGAHMSASAVHRLCRK